MSISMWQSQRFMGEQQDRVLSELLEWLHEHEDVIMEYHMVAAREPDGTQVYMVAYRAKSPEPYPFLT